MVAHQGLGTRIVVQIDTQQLPFAGRESLVPRGDDGRSRHAVEGANIVTWGTPRSRKGREIFVDALTRFAEQSRNPRFTQIIRHLQAPLRVAVRGRDGVGRSTVAAALSAAGLAVTKAPDAAVADVTVTVIAETLKPEELTQLRAATRPAVVVLNKADLIAFGATAAAAHRRAAQCRGLTGLPTVPMIGLLAVADGDDARRAAQHTLASAPADLTSVDAFTHCAHSLRPELRRRLLDTLDRYGIAHAVAAIGDGQASAVPAALRRLSNLDAVVERIDAAGASVRYRRVRSAITEMSALAAQSEDVAAFLASDDAVLGITSAAVDVVESEGMFVDRSDDPTAHLHRAVCWWRYGRGPVSPLHRSAAADICRGSLRLLGQQR